MTTMNSVPSVSIGLPVYNGEEFLSETIKSILAQTYTDFELIISDNGSDDSTQEICEDYARRDSRIRYYRNEVNQGAAWNFNTVFEKSRAAYFKWASHDDLLEKAYLESCVEVMDRDPSVLIAHPKTMLIDENGAKRKDLEDYLDFRSLSPYERFRDYLFRPAGMCNAIFGLIRASELEKTPLIEGYISSDRVLLGEMALRGRIHQLTENLFLRRRHPRISWRASDTRQALASWFDPRNKNKVILPVTWTLFVEYSRALGRVGLNAVERLKCQLLVFVWFVRRIIWPPRRLLRQKRGLYPTGPDIALSE